MVMGSATGMTRSRLIEMRTLISMAMELAITRMTTSMVIQCQTASMPSHTIHLRLWILMVMASAITVMMTMITTVSRMPVTRLRAERLISTTTAMAPSIKMTLIAMVMV